MSCSPVYNADGDVVAYACHTCKMEWSVGQHHCEKGKEVKSLPEIKKINKKEKPPRKNKTPAIWDLVMKDIKERDLVGKEKYGVRLQAFNGRNAMIDAYQEVLDLTVYLRQAIEERDEMLKVLRSYASGETVGAGEASQFLKKLGGW